MFSEICAVMLSFKLLIFLPCNLDLVFPISITIKNHFCFIIQSPPNPQDFSWVNLSMQASYHFLAAFLVPRMHFLSS